MASRATSSGAGLVAAERLLDLAEPLGHRPEPVVELGPHHPLDAGQPGASVSSSSSIRPSSWPSVPSWRESSPSRSVTRRSSPSSFRSTSEKVSRWARCSASWATTARLKSSSTRGTSGTSEFSALVIGPSVSAVADLPQGEAGLE